MTNKPSKNKSPSARNRADIVQLAKVIQAQQLEIAELRAVLSDLGLFVQGLDGGELGSGDYANLTQLLA